MILAHFMKRAAYVISLTALRSCGVQMALLTPFTGSEAEVREAKPVALVSGWSMTDSSF